MEPKCLLNGVVNSRMAPLPLKTWIASVLPPVSRGRRYSVAFVMRNQRLLLMTSGEALIPSLNTGSNV